MNHENAGSAVVARSFQPLVRVASRGKPGSSAMRLGWRRLFAVLGPATLVSVGYMDPGNWATDLEGGSRFGYDLLWVLVLSNAMALLLQTLSARLGIVSGLDLAAACRRHYPRKLVITLWLLAEVAIIACDLAEVLGSAVALNLLFGLPMLLGALLTVCDVFVLLAVQKRGGTVLQAIVSVLVATIGLCLLIELFIVPPAASALASGLIPRLDNARLYIAIGIVGATVMPHNLYLHSGLVKQAPDVPGPDGQRATLRASFFGTTLALNVAMFVNVAILLLASAAFSGRGTVVSDLRDAHGLLASLTGASLASVLFAIGLLCSGQSATITGTLAGQMVMEGFVRLRLSPVVRRLVTRGLAVVPAVVVLGIAGENASMPLLVASQVVLSLQLPFAIIPLIRLTSCRAVMGARANGRPARAACIACASLIIVANGALVVRTFCELRHSAPCAALAFGGLAFGVFALLVVICSVPLRIAGAPVRYPAGDTARPGDGNAADGAGYRSGALADGWL